MFASRVFNVFKRLTRSNVIRKYADGRGWDIEGKCALVTDGTSGVGLAFAKELLEKNAANVIIAGGDEQKGMDAACNLQKYYGREKVIFYKTNVNDTYEFEGTFKYIKENYEMLDIFFNNADSTAEKDVININLASKIQGIIYACKLMKGGDGVIINHTSALGLEIEAKMTAYSAASAGFIAASRAFSDEVHFNENKIRMMTLCSEPISSTMVAETNGSTCTNQSENEDHHAIALSIAKAAAFLTKCGPRNTIWLCQRNGILSTVVQQKMNEFSIKFEPQIEKIDQKKSEVSSIEKKS